MDWLYRIFYTVLSLGILMILLFPAVVIFRFLLRNIEKKYTVLGWQIFFLRSICPIALSSPLCMFSFLNRGYHRFMGDVGLTIRDGKGVMRSWISVFQSEITASWTFKACSVIWAAGVFSVLVFALVSHCKLRNGLLAAKIIGENIYESAVISEPVRLGMFRSRLYLPQGFRAQETAWLLRHMEHHRREGLRRVILLAVMSCHWFNPVMWLYYYWWGIDMEMAADDRTIRREKETERRAYAQGILNFTKDKRGKGWNRRGGIFFMEAVEKHTEKRAHRMMYWKRDRINDRLYGLLLCSIAAVCCFLLRPMQIAWSGGTWGNGEKQVENDSFLDRKTAKVVARMGTKSPEGLERIIQLEMVRGTETEQEYVGTFVIKMYDTMDNEIDSRRVADIFPEMDGENLHFSKNMTLCISDYNGDNAQELVIGQRTNTVPVVTPTADTTATPASTSLSKETAGPALESEVEGYSYTLINIGNKKLEVLCQGIEAAGEKGTMSESVPFGKLEDIDDIFTVSIGEEKIYYVWNDRMETYDKRTMTEEDVEAHRNNIDESAENYGTKEHTLEDSGGVVAVLVTTKQNGTEDEEIRTVTLYPRGDSKKFQDIRGYFCDLLWVESQDEKNRYAQMIYNGTRAQTFVIYDTRYRTVYYQHEDGIENLALAFKQVGEDEITFNEGGAVVYDLQGKNGDVLSINFAAGADNGVTVRGSYQYNIVKRTVSNLSFSRAEE